MYIILKFAMFILSRLSIKNVQRIGSAVGTIAWHIMPQRRKVAVINARIIGAKDPIKTAKESFKHSFMSYLETSQISNIDKEFIDKYVTIENERYYKELREKGQNFAFVSAHMGSWDLVTAAISRMLDFKILIVGRESENKALNRIIEEHRTNENIVYMMNKGYINKVKEYEDKGYVTGSLLDHSTTASESIIAPFFGLNVRTLAGIPALCAKKKIPLLPAYLLRTENGFRAVIHPPIYPNSSLKPKERILDLCTRMNKDFENIIKEAPEQWYLLHKRFKKVEEPDGTISERIYR